MMEEFLKTRLDRVVRRHQRVGLWRTLSVCWGLTALVGLGFLYLEALTGWTSAFTLPVLLAVAASFTVGAVVRHAQRRPDRRWAARLIEAKHPELGGVLLTAVQQRPAGAEERGYFQYRVLQEAVAKLQTLDGRDLVPRSRLVGAQVAHAISLIVLGLVVWQLATEPRLPLVRGAAVTVAGIEVTPGDVELEKGESLVVLARFGDTPPPGVELVILGGSGSPRVPLVKSLADPVFGGSVPDVQADFLYRLEYGGVRTRDFKVSVYEHPQLVRADADLVYPAYTGLEARRIENTRRLSAVEGSTLALSLQLNKSVARAALVARDDAKTRIELAVAPDRAAASLENFPLTATRTYDLELVDADGRRNKTPTPLVFDVQPNRPPELRIATPRGDVRPSALEELAFTGTVWDDFGAPAYGLAYTRAGEETVHVELGRDLPGRERGSFSHLLALEELGVQPGELVSWFVWADDIGPDGQVRRTSSDLFFAEVRPFDEIFRESQNMAGGEQQGGQQGGGPQQQLAELQKQIISATWRLQRSPASAQRNQDAGVVRDSQAQALAQAQAGAAEAFDPSQQALWRAVTTEMQSALSRLETAASGGETLPQALAAEQAAFQALLKLASRETSVTRGGQRGGGGGGGNQRQIDQLDLAQAENRYETQRQARAPQSPERREEMQIVNRLQELARRQEDFNQRLRELQTALQEARTEREREELRRELKRLQEEQQRMLADADELQQRMNRPENQSRLSEQREQLEQTRDRLQEAAEATGEGNVAQALASGTRAQRELQQMRDELRRENSSQFGEDLRQMRSEVRELARNQDELSERLAGLGQEQRRTLSDSGERAELRAEVERQRERMRELFERATEISSQAEATEPLLSRQLYEGLRRTNQEESLSFRELQQELLNSGRLSRTVLERLQQGAASTEGGKSLELVSELLADGLIPQAGAAGRRARSGIEELQRGVERAAESVLGDDAEALRLARQELDDVTEQLRREMAEATRGRGPGREGEAGAPQEGEGQRAGTGGRETRDGELADAGRQPGQPGERGDSGQPGAQGEPTSEGAGGGEGRQQGQGQGQGEGRLAQNRDGATAGESGQGRGGSPNDAREAGRSGRLAGRGDPRGGGGAAGGAGFEGGVFGGEWAGNSGPLDLGDFLDDRRAPGPLTGDEFADWSDRLRNIEELIDDPALRNEVASARERARALRREYRQDLKKPDWAFVRLEIERPLLEVRNRLSEELARRDSRNPLVPIDRDPVPARFAEQVRRYYEELGKDRDE